MKKILLFAICSVILVGCQKGDRTTYEIRYRFDNTRMQSDFLEAYELTDSVHGNGKWRSERHHFDTLVVNGDTTEWAWGTLKDVARDNCVGLSVHTSGWRPCGGGNYDLDTLFFLKEGEDNVFEITPSSRWHNHYE